MIINTETPDQPEIRAMLDKLDAYHAELYPAESNHLLDVDSLLREDALALVNRGGYGEIKRMYVDEATRGRGTGAQLLEHLTMFARMSGLQALMLETGIHQAPAIRLYERAGFVRREPFGDYQADPLSLFMEKRL